MKKVRFTAGALFLFLCSGWTSLNAQTQFEWAKTWGGTEGYEETGAAIVTDKDGNVYTVGTFGVAANFDQGNGNVSVDTKGENDLYVSKLDAAGKLVWVKTIGGKDATAMGRGVTLDAKGNVLVTGTYQNTVDFDPGSSTFEMSTDGATYGFILKLSASGNFVWAKKLGEGAAAAYGIALTVDAQDNIYATGMLMGRGDFDPSAAAKDTFFVEAKGVDIFVSKLTTDGNFVWAKSFQGDGKVVISGGSAIKIDSRGNVLTTGTYSTTFDFNPGAAVFSLSPVEGSSVFVSKLTADGNFVWAKSFDGKGYQAGNALNLDAADNVYTAGYFEGKVDFNPGTAVADTFYLRTNPMGDASFHRNAFISKLDSAGKMVWAQSIRSYGDGDNEARGMNIDKLGDLYITGFYNDSADFDGGKNAHILVSEEGNNSMPSSDVFVAKYNAAGNLVWAKGIKGEGHLDVGTAITTDVKGNIYTTGTFQETIHFDASGSGFESNGYDDVFVLKLSQEKCAFADIDTAVVYTEGTLSAKATDATYQWIDCGQQNKAIEGATNQSFSPEMDGSYAVVITADDCKDTSGCISFKVTGITSLELAKQIKVYPNPATNRMAINAPYDVDIIITDIPGHSLMQQKNAKTISVAGLVDGIYFLHIFDKNGNRIKVERIAKVK